MEGTTEDEVSRIVSLVERATAVLHDGFTRHSVGHLSVDGPMVNVDAAADLTQQVFLQAFRRWISMWAKGG